MKKIGLSEKIEGTAVTASKHINTASRPDIIVDCAEGNGDFLLENILLRPGLRMMVCNHTQPGYFRMAFEIEHSPLGFCFNLSQKIRLTNSGDIIPN